MIAALLAEAGHVAADDWSEYLELLTSKAHVAFELTIEFATGVIVYPFAKWFWSKAVRRHDAEHHDHVCEGTQ